MRKVMLTVCLVCLASIFANSADIPEALLIAKTAYVQNSGAREKDHKKLCEAMKKWGRFELVQDQQNADIFVALSSSLESRPMERPGAGGSMMTNVQVIINRIRIINARDGAVLWTDETTAYDSDPKILVSNLKGKMKKAKVR